MGAVFEKHLGTDTCDNCQKRANKYLNLYCGCTFVVCHNRAAHGYKGWGRIMTFGIGCPYEKRSEKEQHAHKLQLLEGRGQRILKEIQTAKSEGTS